MKDFNINRLNLKKLELGEKELVLKRTTYEEPLYKDGYLIDKNGNKIGTKGDMYTKVIMADILERGTLDLNPRPHYTDGEKAHTLNLNHGNTTLSNTPTLSKIIKNINMPEVLFLLLDIGEENDDVYQVYNNLKLIIDLIKNFIKEDFYVFNNKFSLQYIICMPHSNHYSSLIIKTNKKID